MLSCTLHPEWAPPPPNPTTDGVKDSTARSHGVPFPHVRRVAAALGWGSAAGTSAPALPGEGPEDGRAVDDELAYTGHLAYAGPLAYTGRLVKRYLNPHCWDDAMTEEDKQATCDWKGIGCPGDWKHRWPWNPNWQ